jgi:hypothetical protein
MAVAHQFALESGWRSQILEVQQLVEAAVRRYSTLALHRSNAMPEELLAPDLIELTGSNS